ncbi:hypothetical protein AKJ09_03957 [Labilithrix luteola]|uniref:Uncharacterized protein n=1 Tax=Labilithrix luteola TaxID=1391654 RepID=A0A0K1PUT7_9BACT|nr:hypothetical protein AKJ09_03957 [Labilithrix luteola]
MLRPSACERLDSIRDAATRKDSQSIERKRRPRPVPAQPLPPPIILGSDADGGVQIESCVLERAAFADWSIQVTPDGVPRSVRWIRLA